MWMIDVRARCVAVYKEPKINCLSGLQYDRRCAFFEVWSENEAQHVEPLARARAELICKALNDGYQDATLEPK